MARMHSRKKGKILQSFWWYWRSDIQCHYGQHRNKLSDEKNWYVSKQISCFEYEFVDEVRKRMDRGTASIFSIGADPPEVGAGSNDVGLIVIHFCLSLLLTVAKALPA